MCGNFVPLPISNWGGISADSTTLTINLDKDARGFK